LSAVEGTADCSDRHQPRVVRACALKVVLMVVAVMVVRMLRVVVMVVAVMVAAMRMVMVVALKVVVAVMVGWWR
jgi:hypothetical protein